MPRNSLGSLPRAASRLPRMAPDMSRLPAGGVGTPPGEIPTRPHHPRGGTPRGGAGIGLANPRRRHRVVWQKQARQQQKCRTKR